MEPFAPAEQAPLSRGFYAASAPEVARALLGHVLVHTTAEGTVAGTVVETEAYTADDPASHAFRGLTPRNAPMFAVGGTCYVYRSYGIHWCLNVATGAVGDGAAVLIRALEPVWGLELMARRRGLSSPLALCSGPGKLTQAMGISGLHNGLLLCEGDLRLVRGAFASSASVLSGPRVGISRAVDVPWRFCLAGSRFVSLPRLR